MADPLVQIQGLTKVYPSKSGGITAVEDVNLSIAAGEIFGLLGPNGAGKTTTVRIICGLMAPTAGTVYVDGMSVRERPDEVRSRIGLVPEDAGDYKNLTLIEELEYHGAMYGLDRATVLERSRPLLDRLGLRDRADDRLKNYSRGMRRKFHLIRALLHRPRLLLLDEPTAGLDPSIVEEVWDLLKVLAAEHQVAVVLCSHHLEEVERLCSRVAIMRRRLLIEGSLAELSGGDGRYRLELVDGAEAMAEAVGRIAGVVEAKASGGVMHFRVDGSPDEVVPEVVRCVVEHGGRVLQLKREERDLRSLYRSFVANDGAGAEGGKHV
jgi:ABC-2 type transport system ATP-binding protein